MGRIREVKLENIKIFHAVTDAKKQISKYIAVRKIGKEMVVLLWSLSRTRRLVREKVIKKAKKAGFQVRRKLK